MLEELSQAYRELRTEVEAQARSLSDGLSKLTSYGLEATSSELTEADVVQAARALERQADPVQGGFGLAPKFPMASGLSLLLRGYRRTRDEQLARVAMTALKRMAEGGLYDQLGGGFHRYSTDAGWKVPHFEKMLYDNAQLLFVYAEAQLVEPRPLWLKVAEETAGYVRREMTSPEGAFYATQDADSEGAEGKFFVWTPAELEAFLPAGLAELAGAHFGVKGPGNFEHQTSVLRVAKDSARLARERKVPVEGDRAPARRRALEAVHRARERVKPARDEKIITSWNGLMIRGLSFASRAFGRPEWALLARGAADFALERLWRNGRLSHTAHGQQGFLEDYGHLASGLVALYQATFETRYLDAARLLADRATELFWDAERVRVPDRSQRAAGPARFRLRPVRRGRPFGRFDADRGPGGPGRALR